MKRASATLALAAFASTALAAATLPAGWKVSEEAARDFALDSLVGGGINFWGLKQGWEATPAGARAALITGGLEWAKAFAASPAFAQAYAERRAQSKPEPTTYEQTVEQEMAAERAKQAKEAADFKAQIKQFPAEQQKTMRDMAAMMDAQAKQMAADPQMQKMIRDGKEMERAERKKSDAEALAQWQKDWPADPKPLIAKRLREFLAACGDVDFNAKLIDDPSIGKKRFAETRYEMKPSEWKYCYRAGRAPVEAARAFAQAWLKELPAK